MSIEKDFILGCLIVVVGSYAMVGFDTAIFGLTTFLTRPSREPLNVPCLGEHPVNIVRHSCDMEFLECSVNGGKYTESGSARPTGRTKRETPAKCLS